MNSSPVEQPSLADASAQPPAEVRIAFTLGMLRAVLSLHACLPLLIQHQGMINQSLCIALQAEDTGPANIEEKVSQAQKGPAGMGANLVSAVRSFLPFVSKAADAQPQPAAGKKPVKVRHPAKKFKSKVQVDRLDSLGES